MGVIETALRKLDKMKASIPKGIQASINKNDHILIDQQTEQFDKGQDSQGAAFTPSYTPFTIGLKQAKQQPTNRVTLRDTGDLYNRLSIAAFADHFVISPNVPYFFELVERYDANTILGIQPEEMKDFLIDYSLPEIEKNFNQILRK